MTEIKLRGKRIKHDYTDESFFSEINSELKAYLLGIFFCGGILRPEKKSIGFKARLEDKEILDLISETIYHQNYVTSGKDDGFKGGVISKLLITSQKIKDGVVALGCHHSRTLGKFPTLSDELLPHFIRGVFDKFGYFDFNEGGEGKNSYRIIYIAENEYNLNYISKLLTQLNIKHRVNNRIEISTKDDCLKFFNYIYENANYKLSRKYNKYKEFYKTCGKISYGENKFFDKISYFDVKKILIDIEIVCLYKDGFSSKMIARKLGLAKNTIIQAYKRLGFSGIKRYVRKNLTRKEKFCKGCGQTKEISNFKSYIQEEGNYLLYSNLCLICEEIHKKELNKQSYLRNKNWHVQYRGKNLEKKKAYNIEYGRKHKAELRRKYLLNIDKNRARMRKYDAWRSKNDPMYKLRSMISKSIGVALRRINPLGKNGQSCMKYLPYSILELKVHLEKQFEPWMNWKNHGAYVERKWDDNDSSTWRWNVDHIIPQSTLPFLTMDEENFHKCWALENLRPYNAKQNILDGASRIRHK